MDEREYVPDFELTPSPIFPDPRVWVPNERNSRYRKVWYSIIGVNPTCNSLLMLLTLPLLCHAPPPPPPLPLSSL